MALKHDRMAERMRALLSDLILREVKDPRLKGITITEVELDGDLRYADVYVNALGDESRREEVLEGLDAANGFLRREVGQRIRARNTPELKFQWDETLEQGENINQLLDELDIPSEKGDVDDDE